eukprot:scaffold125774_cov18-Tisochrysis_lutea.AAC.1
MSEQPSMSGWRYLHFKMLSTRSMPLLCSCSCCYSCCIGSLIFVRPSGTVKVQPGGTLQPVCSFMQLNSDVHAQMEGVLTFAARCVPALRPACTYTSDAHAVCAQCPHLPRYSMKYVSLADNRIYGPIPQSWSRAAQPGIFVALETNYLSCCGTNPLSVRMEQNHHNLM